MNTPFISRVEKVQEGITIGSIIGKRTAGDVGLEIECEGNVLEKNDLPSNWTYHKDGSLRGKDNAEYVLFKPIPFAKVPEQVKALWEMFDKKGTKLDLSNRTSVHVHLNVQRFHMNRLCAFLTMWYSLEEILTKWCGDHRVGNLFCLRAKDAHGVITALKKYLQYDGNWSLADGFHYAGMNCQALQKFGSLEVRTLRGPTEPDPILDWVSILERLHVLSGDYPDPRDIIANFSGHDPIEFMDMLLGPWGEAVRSEVEMSTEQIRDSLYEGIRLAQDVSYCRDWSNFSPFPEGDDPFRRDRPRRSKSAMLKINKADAWAADNLADEDPYLVPTMPAPMALNEASQMVDFQQQMHVNHQTIVDHLDQAAQQVAQANAGTFVNHTATFYTTDGTGGGPATVTTAPTAPHDWQVTWATPFGEGVPFEEPQDEPAPEPEGDPEPIEDMEF